MKFIAVSLLKHSNRRSPHGERGLKSAVDDDASGVRVSLSSWRAWIEMPKPIPDPSARKGRSPHGERGLKYHREHRARIQQAGRSPHGERGLKYRLDFLVELRGSRSPHGERGLKFQDEG